MDFGLHDERKLNQTPGDEASIVPPEAEGVVHDDVDLLFPWFVRDVVQIALGVGFVEVNGGR
jgi:hypothetical protein